jgi:hypothetical protein
VCDMKNSVYGSAGRLLSLQLNVTGIFRRPLFPLIANYLFEMVEANIVSLLVHFIHTVLAR